LLELADDNLERHLKTYTTSNKALIQIFRQICVGLKHAHANNIAHRDLHEKNILIKRERDANIAKLSDFGRAKDFSMAAITTNPCLWGALSITSPEVIAQVTNKDSTPDRQFIADIFSLGVILHSVFNPSSSFYITKIIELYETAQRNGVFSNHATIDTRNNFYDYCIGYFRYNNLNDYLMVKACLDEDALKQLNQLISEMINPDYRLRASNLDEILAKCDSIDVLLGNR
jgi:serine/threonine protein kinase